MHMAWNPYTDQKNRAYSGIVTALFPEQTKTVPRILVWSLVFLADLILGIGGAAYLGWLTEPAFPKLVTAGLIAAIVGIFWLQGAVWYTAVKYIQKRRELG